ncbi:MAG: hypothetical protein WD534_01750 [Phycisphaeraceae bacterium]
MWEELIQPMHGMVLAVREGADRTHLFAMTSAQAVDEHAFITAAREVAEHSLQIGSLSLQRVPEHENEQVGIGAVQHEVLDQVADFPPVAQD